MNKNKFLPFIIGGVVVLIVVAVVLIQNSQKTYVVSSPTQNPDRTATTTYSSAQVATHNSQASCWTSINGGVYDVTAWILKHPGGSRAILSLCGKDGSSAFNDQHGGERRPEAELASFKIGVLK